MLIINFPDFQSTMRRIMPRVEIVKRAAAARHHKHLQFYEDEWIELMNNNQKLSFFVWWNHFRMYVFHHYYLLQYLSFSPHEHSENDAEDFWTQVYVHFIYLVIQSFSSNLIHAILSAEKKKEDRQKKLCFLLNHIALVLINSIEFM